MKKCRETGKFYYCNDSTSPSDFQYVFIMGEVVINGLGTTFGCLYFTCRMVKCISLTSGFIDSEINISLTSGFIDPEILPRYKSATKEEFMNIFDRHRDLMKAGINQDTFLAYIDKHEKV